MLKNVKINAGGIVRIAASEAETMFLSGTGDPVSNSIWRALKAGFSETEARKTPWAELRKRLEAKKEPKKVETKAEEHKKEPEAKESKKEKFKKSDKDEVKVEAKVDVEAKPARRQKRPEKADK